MKKIKQVFSTRIRQGLISSGLIALLIMLLGGLGFWFIDPKVHTFTDGLWLAFTTAATVGYGDHVPSTDVSRAFAVVVVLLGLAVLSLVTASIAAVFVQKDDYQIDQALLTAIHTTQQQLERLEVIVTRLEASHTQATASTTSAAARNPSTAVGTPQ